MDQKHQVVYCFVKKSQDGMMQVIQRSALEEKNSKPHSSKTFRVTRNRKQATKHGKIQNRNQIAAFKPPHDLFLHTRHVLEHTHVSDVHLYFLLMRLGAAVRKFMHARITRTCICSIHVYSSTKPHIHVCVHNTNA